MSTTEPDDPKTGTGAEGNASDDLSVPFEPRKDDDTPVGDTDQHSKVSSHAPSEEEKRARQNDSASDD